MAVFGTICHFIIVGDDLVVLSFAYSTSERFYGHINKPRTSSTTISKNENHIWFSLWGNPKWKPGAVFIFHFFMLDMDLDLNSFFFSIGRYRIPLPLSLSHYASFVHLLVLLIILLFFLILIIIIIVIIVVEIVLFLLFHFSLFILNYW